MAGAGAAEEGLKSVLYFVSLVRLKGHGRVCVRGGGQAGSEAARGEGKWERGKEDGDRRTEAGRVRFSLSQSEERPPSRAPTHATQHAPPRSPIHARTHQQPLCADWDSWHHQSDASAAWTRAPHLFSRLPLFFDTRHIPLSPFPYALPVRLGGPAGRPGRGDGGRGTGERRESGALRAPHHPICTPMLLPRAFSRHPPPPHVHTSPHIPLSSPPGRRPPGRLLPGRPGRGPGGRR